MTKTRYIFLKDDHASIQKPKDAVYFGLIGNQNIHASTTTDELEKIAQSLVNYRIHKPSAYTKFLKVPHVKHGFENSCSECSAESVIRYWQTQGYDHLKGWNQFSMHRAGYQTFEGNISEGDRGLYALFKILNLTIVEKNNAKISDIFGWIDKGIPVIVRITTDIFQQNQHTQVAIGYSQTDIFLNDNDEFSKFHSQYITLNQKSFLNGFTGKILVVYPNDCKIK